MRPFRLNRLAMTNGKAVIIIQAAMEGLMAAWPWAKNLAVAVGIVYLYSFYMLTPLPHINN